MHYPLSCCDISLRLSTFVSRVCNRARMVDVEFGCLFVILIPKKKIMK